LLFVMKSNKFRTLSSSRRIARIGVPPVASRIGRSDLDDIFARAGDEGGNDENRAEHHGSHRDNALASASGSTGLRI